MDNKKVSIIGCGRWGTFIAWYVNQLGFNTTLYGRENSPRMQELLKTGSNDLITLDKNIKLEVDIEKALKSDIIIISVGAQSFRSLMQEIKAKNPVNKIYVLCMKGIEIASGKRLSEIAEEYIDSKSKIAVWLGPGHVQEFYKGIPNCMVIDSNDEDVKDYLISSFSSDLIRFYYGNDLLGNEIGAATKNIIGIAAGMLDGFNLKSLKGSLISRGTREIARLIKAMGGNELSTYGLCHLGDYEATVFSEFSHNRKFGELFIKGEDYQELAEGYYSVKAIVLIAEKYNTEIPICRAVYDILYEKKDAAEVLKALFLRSQKQEI